MKSAPKKIYLQIGEDAESYPADHEGVSWCWDKINSSDIRYVRVDLATISTLKPVSTYQTPTTAVKRGSCGSSTA
jgi:hypothetical protein